MADGGGFAPILLGKNYLVICWIQNVEQNGKNNLISFSLFTGSVQLNQEWEAWMGSVSVLDFSLLIMNYSLFSYCLYALEVILKED